MMARASADVLFEWDLNAHRVWWGGGISGRFGYPHECVEFNVDDWSSHIYPDDRARVLEGVYSSVEKSRESWSDEFRVLRQDRSVAFVLARGLVLRDHAHRPLKLIGGMQDITARRECEENLDRSRRQLRALSLRLEQLREEDRRRISRDLHDTLGQMLTGLKMDLGWIEKNLVHRKTPRASILEKLMETEDIVDSTIAEVQRMATEFRPDALDTLGLRSAIKCELELFQRRSGLECQLEAEEGLPDPSPGTSIGLFRILQEALTNVARHAQATRVNIRLGKEGTQFKLEISDDGKGIDPAELLRPTALGLLGMREHATMLGGSLELGIREPHGTTVSVLVPILETGISIWELPS